ncbi:Nitrogen regulation protein NR(I) [Planctomycetes bacterium Poly30]|uniref:Nitrogen regulation protein NR(I) n=1 Tax=Saltatorellus ferox TaxID=2528018 RepID=A0A518EUK0_9BACT|nr:Nitrogen regulation protein NR(I) [Planctomycetes bacterium Poly30]
MRSEEKTGRRTILVVDDDGDIRQALEGTLQYEGFNVWTARNGEEALARLRQEKTPPAAILTDLKMPKVDGLELLDSIIEEAGSAEAAPPVIMISGHGDVPVAVDAMQRGAVNFLEKPLDEHRVLVTIHKALRERALMEENAGLQTENRGLKERLRSGFELIGESDAMKKLRDSILRVADSESSVLITGENGVGKELVARNVHLSGPRAGGPFITVNCAAIPAELVESELFGHLKGSFTGAHEDRVGHFEAADGGNLFLDEVGDMPLAAQAKVLRALETHEVMRVGDSQTRSVNIRVIAATNADLARSVEDKSFRLDLFYRLNVVPLHVPPLRERTGDIPMIARHLLERQAARIGRSPDVLSDDAAETLQSFGWPGNVRQLRNVLEAASIFAEDSKITSAEIARVMESGPGMTRSVGGGGGALGGGASSGGASAPTSRFEAPFDAATFEDFKNEAEALFFRTRLDRNNGNVKRTAEELGMQRSHLYKKLDRYDLK